MWCIPTYQKYRYTYIHTKNIGIKFHIDLSVWLFQLYPYTEIYDIP